MNNENKVAEAPIIAAAEQVTGAAALRDLVDLDPDGGAWLNRQAHLTVSGGVLGGQIAAHCLVAAGAEKDGFRPCSLHVTYVSSPDPMRRWNLETEAVRDGRNFAHRLVRMTQGGKAIAHASSLLKSDGATAGAMVDYHPELPTMPAPESLPPRVESLNRSGSLPQERAMIEAHSFIDIRLVPDEAVTVPPSIGAQTFYWVRFPDARPLAPVHHQALLTLMTDFWFTLPVQQLARQGGITDPIITTSLDHCVWYHSPIDCSEWMLFHTEGTVATGGSGMKRSMVWAQDGTPLANVEQQALARFWTK